MENLPEKFVKMLLSMVNSEDNRAKRLAKKLEEEPEACARVIYNEIGSSTQPIKLRND